MSYEDVLPILRELLYTHVKCEVDEAKVYSEDEFMTILCNEQVIKQLNSVINHHLHDTTAYYCFMKNEMLYYSLSRDMDYIDDYELVTDYDELSEIMERNTVTIKNKIYNCDVEIDYGDDCSLCINITIKN